MDSWLEWKHWLGGALCPRAGAVGGRLPSASQQMPQLELHLYFYAPSLKPVFASPEGGPEARAVRHPEDVAWPQVPGPAEEGGAGLVGVFHALASFTRPRDSDPSPSKERKGGVFLCFLELSAQPFAGLSTRRGFPEGCFSVRRAESGG